MAEINISSHIQVNDSVAEVTLNTARALNSTVHVNDSKAEIIGDSLAMQRAIRSTVNGNNSKATVEVQKLAAIRSTVHANTSAARAAYNVQRAVDSTIHANTSAAKFMPTVQRAIDSTVNVNSSVALAIINVQRAIQSELPLNESTASLRYLFLKNPPLPPESNGIKVRSSKSLLLKQSQLIAGETYMLDVAIVGERLQGTHLVFTVKHGGLRGTLSPVLEKSTAGCPLEYLSLPDAGKGDIMINSITPVASIRGSQEVLATIFVKPDEIAKHFPRIPGTYNYELWAYDLMGLNALLESGSFGTISTGGIR